MMERGHRFIGVLALSNNPLPESTSKMTRNTIVLQRCLHSHCYCAMGFFFTCPLLESNMGYVSCFEYAY